MVNCFSILQDRKFISASISSSDFGLYMSLYLFILFQDPSKIKGEVKVTFCVVISSTSIVSVIYPNSIFSPKLFKKSIRPLEAHLANQTNSNVVANQSMSCFLIICIIHE